MGAFRCSASGTGNLVKVEEIMKRGEICLDFERTPESLARARLVTPSSNRTTIRNSLGEEPSPGEHGETLDSSEDPVGMLRTERQRLAVI